MNAEILSEIDKARDLIAHGNPVAVGYRLMIKPIEATTQLEQIEKSEFKTLGKAGFEVKTEHQKDRESFGTHHGILISKGEHAFKAEGWTDWVQVGDVVIFDKYAGVEVELPPGSGNKFRFTNDESILGKMQPSEQQKFESKRDDLAKVGINYIKQETKHV